MAENESRRIKCGAAVIRGFLAERSEHSFHLLKWIEGDLQNTRLLGLPLADIDIKGRKQFNVRATHCEGCGYLELYAV